MIKTSGTLRIMRYRALNGTWYRIAFFDGDFRFVFISKKTMQTCSVGRTRNGKKYIEYTGPFTIADDGTLCIN